MDSGAVRCVLLVVVVVVVVVLFVVPVWCGTGAGKTARLRTHLS